MGREGKDEGNKGDGSGNRVNGKPAGPRCTDIDIYTTSVVRNGITMVSWTTNFISILLVVAVSPNSKTALCDSP